MFYVNIWNLNYRVVRKRRKNRMWDNTTSESLPPPIFIHFRGAPTSTLRREYRMNERGTERNYEWKFVALWNQPNAREQKRAEPNRKAQASRAEPSWARCAHVEGFLARQKTHDEAELKQQSTEQQASCYGKNGQEGNARNRKGTGFPLTCRDYLYAPPQR